MRRLLPLLPLLMISAPLSAQNGPPGGGGGPGMGGPPGGGERAMRQPKPLKRSDFDKEVEALFRKGDVDRDGIITLAEFNSVIDTRRDEVILARFRRVDSNGDGTLSTAEFRSWQTQLGTAAMSEDTTVRHDEEMISSFIEVDGGESDKGHMMRSVIEPIGATLIATANTNYDRGVTLDELLAYEGKKFAAADANGDGEIAMDEMPRGDGKSGPRPPQNGGGGAMPPAPPRNVVS